MASRNPGAVDKRSGAAGCGQSCRASFVLSNPPGVVGGASDPGGLLRERRRLIVDRQLIHIYDPEKREVFYSDGRVEQVPEEVIRHATPGREADVIAMWAKRTRRIGADEAIAVLAAA